MEQLKKYSIEQLKNEIKSRKIKPKTSLKKIDGIKPLIKEFNQLSQAYKFHTSLFNGAVLVSGEYKWVSALSPDIDNIKITIKDNTIYNQLPNSYKHDYMRVIRDYMEVDDFAVLKEDEGYKKLETEIEIFCKKVSKLEKKNKLNPMELWDKYFT